MKKKKKKEKLVDRRIQKTKKLLSNALSSLIVAKGYAAVSIKDIIDKANVGRSTFYAHFENKEQLLLYGHDTFKRLMNENVVPVKKDHGSTIIDFLFLYEHMKEQAPIVKALMGQEGGEIVAEHVQGIFAHRIKEVYGNHPAQPKDKESFLFSVNAAAAAMMSLIIQWIKNDMPFTPEEMAEKSEKLLEKMMG